MICNFERLVGSLGSPKISFKNHFYKKNLKKIGSSDLYIWKA